MKMQRRLVLVSAWLVAGGLCANAALASTPFRIRVVNNSYTALEAQVTDSSGTVIAEKKIDGRDAKDVDFSMSCKNTKSWSFRLVELQTNSEVASGEFTIVSGRKDPNDSYSCKHETFTWDSCADSSAGDAYDATCSIIEANDGRDRNGKVTIE